MASDITDHLLDRLYVAIDTVDDPFDGRHITIDMMCNLQVSRNRHQILFFCERIQPLQSIRKVGPSRHSLQNISDP
jgi:hypothetical protein